MSATVTEASTVEFTIMCPIDGSVEVSLEDIESVVLKGPNRADITFVCPHCGTQIQVTAIVPAFLLTAIEALAQDPDSAAMHGIVVVPADQEIDAQDAHSQPPATSTDQPRHDAYCEYFRRQLEAVECVEDALAEIDSRSTAL